MALFGSNKYSRVFGDDAVLMRLDRLGGAARVFEGLVRVGFPPEQLADAVKMFIKGAKTPVERFAGQQMLHGIFEDESLQQFFVNYFECTDWKLESSPWFLSRDDYKKFYRVLLEPVDFHVEQLQAGFGEERWGGSFVKLPFDLGMKRAKRSLWEEIIQQEYYWKPQTSYVHLRAQHMFAYLRQTMAPSGFSPNSFSYEWERTFRVRFAGALESFTEELERWVRNWQEDRKERAGSRFQYQQYRIGVQPPLRVELNEALTVLGLDSQPVTLDDVRQSFRQLSKSTHPDGGGSPEKFRRLVASKDTLESWLRIRGDA